MREHEGNEWGGLEQFPSVEVKRNFPQKNSDYGRYGWGDCKKNAT